MNRLDFFGENDINEFMFFMRNYGHIMTIFDICNTLQISKIRNLSIENNNINFNTDIPKNIKSASDIPINSDVSVYGERYELDFNNNDNVLNISMRVSTM